MHDAPIDTPGFTDLAFPTRHVGRRIASFRTVGSTSDVLETTLDFDGVVALRQSAGRGQYGRIWQAPAEASLLLSLKIDPPAHLNRPVILTAWAAVAVAEAILELGGVQARIKWPNDLLLKGKKVCGLLIERKSSTIVGLGWNLNQTDGDFAVAGLPEATSLAAMTGRTINRDAALACVLKHLDDEYDRLLAGEIVAVESDWKWRLGLLGRTVEVEMTDGGRLVGRLREIGFDGAELEIGDGAGVRTIPPERIRQLRQISGDDERNASH